MTASYQWGNINKEKNYEKEQTGNFGLENMKSEMKSSLETFKIRFELTKENINISKLENRSIEIMKSEEKRKIMKKHKQSLREMWNTINKKHHQWHI